MFSEYGEVFNKAVDGLESRARWFAGLRLGHLELGVKRSSGDQ